MINLPQIQDCFKNLLGWKDHYNNDIPNLPASLSDTDTGDYYNNYHSLITLANIKAVIPADRNLEEYLSTVRDNGIISLLSDLNTVKEINSEGKDLLGSAMLLRGHGWVKDGITNDSRFVGFQLKGVTNLGVMARINELGFQFTQPQTNLKIYLYNTNSNDPIIKEVTTTAVNGWHWVKNIDFELPNNDGGIWYLGYYQDDLIGQAINNTDYTWKSVPCRGCDGGIKAAAWENVARYLEFKPMYVPLANHVAGRTMFDTDDIYFETKNWGMNFKVSSFCDLSEFYCNNRNNLRTALGYKVAHQILTDILFSSENNAVTNKHRVTIIRELEGDKDTKAINLVDTMKNSIKAVKVDLRGIGKVCLPCKKGTTYGTVR